MAQYLISVLTGVIEAADLDVARRLAAQGSKACEGRVELRPLLAG